MDSQLRINGTIGTAILAGKFFGLFNKTFSQEDSDSNEPEWFFVGSTCRVPEEVSCNS